MTLSTHQNSIGFLLHRVVALATKYLRFAPQWLFIGVAQRFAT
ncbi:hypothetical protein [Paraburkholderia sp. CNPSo 3274]|nr:hypothetical protein [Paraburkholderia sp. CNPSo 3274]